MKTVEAGAEVRLKNILYLTDFSEPAEVALPFATAMARGYGATVHATHVFMPAPHVYTTPALTVAATEAEEESAKAAMGKVEADLAGLRHETIVEQGIGVWPATEQAIKEHAIDLVVLGTHLLGSVAEETFRRSPVPVLTIGPGVRSSAHNGGFHRVLFAADFTPESLAAARYAISLAQENHSRLLALYVMRKPSPRNELDKERFEMSVAEAIHRLYEVVPEDVRLDPPLEVAVEYGEPAACIVEAAKDRSADLIVLGVRNAAQHIGAATHLGRATAHKVVADAPCPVLTVRG